MDRTLTYATCGLLIIAYAWARFNTPPSNRSSTRQALYWSSAIGYVLSALALFATLAILLNAGPWRKLLLGPADDPALPAPLIATLAMTTLLPVVPTLKRIDEWFLSIFLDWAEIPGEIRRRAATMTLENFSVTKEDVVALRQSYTEAGYGDTLAHHLRRRGTEGLEVSQQRLTRIVKLYDRVCKLANEPRYRHFFAETASEFDELDRTTSGFLRRAATSLTLAERVRTAETAATYDELVQERREEFANNCRDTFRLLALFLARAVLRSESSEMGIVRRLRAVGFDAAEPMNLPRFPIHSLTVLALAIFVYLLVAVVFFDRLMGSPQLHQISGLMIAVKVAAVRLGTIGLTVWLMQRYSFFRREPGDPPRFFAYVLNGLIAAGAAAGISVLFHLGNPDLLPIGDLPLILLSFMLCTALALCCDDWVEEKIPPVWLRVVEATGCAAAMALGMAFVVTYLSGGLPFSADQLIGSKLVMLFVFPSAMAFVIGGCVPHIYRSARRAATARRAEVSQVAVAPLPGSGLSASEISLSEEKEEGRSTADMQQRLRGEVSRRRRGQVIAGHFTDRVRTGRRKRSVDATAVSDPQKDDRRIVAIEQSVGKRERNGATGRLGDLATRDAQVDRAEFDVMDTVDRPAAPILQDKATAV